MKRILLLVLMALPLISFSQGSLLDDIADEKPKDEPKRTKVYETFFGNRVINGQSIETPDKNSLSYIIAHRLGYMSSGFESMFGVDQASVRMGLEYGILDNLCIGFARNKGNTWDAFIKYRLLSQSKGNRIKDKHYRGMPISLAFFASMAIDGRKKLYTDGRPEFMWQRMMYSYQLLLSRKFGERFSLQIMPSVVWRNIVATKADPNILFSLGGATRIKISKSIAIVGEYYHAFNENRASGRKDVASLGVDINTGGHVFQVHLTNAQLMYEAGFIGNTLGDIAKGNICLGFNITRSFGLGGGGKKKKK